MNRIRCRLLTLAIALCVVAPVFGGGEGGWVNVPAKGGGGPATREGPFRVQQEIGLPVRLVLPANMTQAVAVVQVAGMPPVVTRARERRFAIDQHVVAALVAAGVREMTVTFVAQADQVVRLDVNLLFDPANHTTTIVVR